MMRGDYYDELIELANPHYYPMLRSGVSEIIAFMNKHSDSVDNYHIIDLGIGTANQLERLNKELRSRIRFKVLGIDMDAAMLAQGKTRSDSISSSDSVGVELCEQMIENIDWVELKYEPDIVMTNQTLHYLSPKDRRKTIREVYKHLSAPGLFVYGDRVIGTGPYYEERYKKKVNEAIRRIKRKTRSLLYDIDLDYFEYGDREHPGTLESMISDLSGGGFQEIEISWKQSNYVVLVAIKTSPDGE